MLNPSNPSSTELVPPPTLLPPPTLPLDPHPRSSSSTKSCSCRCRCTRKSWSNLLNHFLLGRGGSLLFGNSSWSLSRRRTKSVNRRKTNQEEEDVVEEDVRSKSLRVASLLPLIPPPSPPPSPPPPPPHFMTLTLNTVNLALFSIVSNPTIGTLSDAKSPKDTVDTSRPFAVEVDGPFQPFVS